MSIPVIGTITLDGQVTAPGAATVALASPAAAGNVDDGDHRVKVTFVTGVGETEAGTQSAIVSVVDKAVNGQVAISAIPVSTSPLVTGRNVYMTEAGGSDYFLLSNGVIANNTATTLTANDSDVTLGGNTAAPATNTTTESLSLFDALEAAIIARGFPQIVAFAQLILVATSGNVSLSTDADISAESEGIPISDWANFYAIGPRDAVNVAGQYLFSETVDATVSFYARPIL